MGKINKINDIISEYAKKNPVRFHMPGHKGEFDVKDVTELFFTDNLYNPDLNTGLIFELEKRISECFFENIKAVSYISCAGATLGIQAAVLSLIRNKTKSNDLYIICDRASHVSFINTLALLDVNPLWIYPNDNFLEKIKYYIKNHKNIIGVFVTSPDYFGGMRVHNNYRNRLRFKLYTR